MFSRGVSKNIFRRYERSLGRILNVIGFEHQCNKFAKRMIISGKKLNGKDFHRRWNGAVGIVASGVR